MQVPLQVGCRTQEEGVFRRTLGQGWKRGAHHGVKSKSEEHQEKDDGPERREGQPG